MKLKSLAAAAVLAIAGSGAYAVVSPTFDAAGSASFESGTLAVGGFTQVINFLGLGSGTYDITGSLSGNKATFSFMNSP